MGRIRAAACHGPTQRSNLEDRPALRICALSCAAALDGTRRVEVLSRAVRAIREAVAQTGPLTEGELTEFAARDLAAGRTSLEPVRGRVLGIDASGALKVDVGSEVVLARGGSLVLQEDGP